MSKIDIQSVRHSYNSTEKIWNSSDLWHFNTRKCLERHLGRMMRRLGGAEGKRVLNAGSAGDPYGISSWQHIHADVSDVHLKGCSAAAVCDIHSLPFSSDTFDLCLSLGSVLNYCSATDVFGEVARVLKPGAHFIFDFESTESFEFGGTHRGKSLEFINTDYNGHPESIWVYGFNYVISALTSQGFRVIQSDGYNIIPSLVYLFTKNERLSVAFSAIDGVASRIPPLRKGAANFILLCQKRFWSHPSSVLTPLSLLSKQWT